MANKSYTLPDGTQFDVPEGMAPDKVRQELLGAGHKAEDINTALTKSGQAHYTFPSGETFSVQQSLHPDTLRKDLSAAGYSSDDIDKALSSAKFDDPLRDFGRKALDYGKAIGTGAAKAIPDLAGAMVSGATHLGEGEASLAFPPGQKPESLAPDPGFITNKVGEAIGGWHKPEGWKQELAEAGGGGLVSGLFGPTAPARTAISNVPRMVPYAAKMFHYGVAPSVAGEGARQATEGVKAYEWIPGIGGKDISPAVGAVTSIFSPLLTRKGITPNTVTDPVVAQRYRTAAEGYRNAPGDTKVPTAGQLFQDPRMINEELAANPKFNKQQKDNYNRAMTSEIGEPTESITAGGSQSYLGRNFRRIGDRFNRLEANTSIDPNQAGANIRRNPQVYNDLVNLFSNRQQNMHHIPEVLKVLESVNPRFRPTNYPNSVIADREKIHDALFRTAGTGGTYTLPGNQYRQIRTALHSAADVHPSPQVANSMRQVANVLDEAMERGVPQNLRGEWDSARRQYAHALVAQDAIAKQGAGARQMTPDQFKSSAQRVMGREPYLRRDLENNAFNEAVGEFPPLKRTNLPDKPTMAEELASYIPYVGPAALRFGPMAAGAIAGHTLGAGPEQATYAILGGMLGEGGHLASKAASAYNYANNPLVQMHRKNQLLPLHSDQANQRNAAMIARYLLTKKDQDQNNPSPDSLLRQQ